MTPTSPTIGAFVDDLRLGDGVDDELYGQLHRALLEWKVLFSGTRPSRRSAALLEVLCRQAHLPEYQCRLRWKPGTLAFWDNRSTQHYAVSDYPPQLRVMERITVIGDRPI